MQSRAIKRFAPVLRIAAGLGGLLVLASPCNAQGTPGTPPTSATPPAESTTAKAPPATPGTVVKELDTHISSVFQAKDGTYWFASRENGVYHFDGKRIVHYTTEHGLGSNAARSVQEDRAGNIYVGSQPGGVSRFDGHTFSTLGIALHDPHDPSSRGWKLQPDDLWFAAGQDTGAVYRYDGKTVHLLTFPGTKAGDDHYAELPRSQYPNAKYSPYDVYTIFKDSKGHLWFGTSSLGVCRFDGKSFAWAHKTEIGFPADDAFGVRGIIEDREGKFWFTLTGTRYEVQPDAAAGATPTTGQLRLRKAPGVGPKDPISAFVSAIKDKDGQLWFATLGDGVYRYDGKETAHYPVTGDAGAPIRIYSIYRDAQGGLWVCTQGGGVYKFNGKAFEKFRP